MAARRLLTSGELRGFAHHRLARWLGAVALEWSIIGSVMWACSNGPWWLWPIGIFVIGTRQHALGILAHESVHRLVSPHRRLNDGLGNLLAAYPLTYPVEGYRIAHLRHHRLLDTIEDPERVSVDLYPEEWAFPIRKPRAAWLLVRDLSGLQAIAVRDLVKYIWQFPRHELRRQIARVAAWHAVAITVALLTGHIWLYVLLWLVPLFTVAIMCFRIRTVAEHSGIYPGEVRFMRTTEDTIATTRTITGSRVLQFLFAPYHMCYHVEHHLYPSVPVFALRRLHLRLLADDEFASRVHVTRTYAGLFGEVTK